MVFIRAGYEQPSWRRKTKKEATVCEQPPGLQNLGPPGLDLPPGLELPQPAGSDKIELPPGLEDISTNGSASTRSLRVESADDKVASIPVAKVCISGLPKALLNDLMMEAMLNQAKLDWAAIDHVFTHGSPCGEALVSFSNLGAAMQCVQHFEGCQWDASGAVVHCETIPIVPFDNPMAEMERSLEPADIPVVPWLLASPKLEPLWSPYSLASEPWVLSADAQEFEPAADGEHIASPRKGLSAAAAVFVPGAPSLQGNLKPGTMSTLPRSEISTDEETASASEDSSVPQLTEVACLK